MFVGAAPAIWYSTQEKERQLKQAIIGSNHPVKPPVFRASANYFNTGINVTATLLPINSGKFGNKTGFPINRN
jgi:hypothetical protein